MRLRQWACSLGNRQAWGSALLTQFVHRDENSTGPGTVRVAGRQRIHQMCPGSGCLQPSLLRWSPSFFFMDRGGEDRAQNQMVRKEQGL